MVSTIHRELPNNVVAASSIAKSYQVDGSRVDVLTGVDLTLAQGETVAIVGPSGSGKSTLLHLLGLLDRPTSGEYRFEGQDVSKLGDKEKTELRLNRIGFIFQFHHLLPEFSALENVMLPALMRNLPKPTAEKRARGLLEEVGMGHRLKHRPGELSGGEQQRVALARALTNSPALVLADEPTGNLDQVSSIRMREVLWETCKRNKTALVLVTHNLTLAGEADSELQMHEGRLIPLNRDA